MTNLIQRFWNDEEGATAIEYGLIAGLIAVAIIGTVTTLGTDLSKVFENISTKLAPATTGTGGTGGTGGISESRGAFGIATFGISSITSVHDVRNGGSFCSTLARISSSSANRKKRFQLMPTSQLPYW